MNPRPIRVLLADDHALVRAGIQALLEKIPDIEVVAQAGDGVVALELVRTFQPDLVLLDISMPELNGLEVVERLKREFPHIRVIILTIHDEPAYAVDALRAGANGYLPKKAASDELVCAIHTVMLGETYLSPEISKGSLADYHSSMISEGRVEELTPRQLDVLRMIAEGYSTKEIARGLNISAKTVETHRAALMERLDIHDVAGLVRFAIKTGLVKMAIGFLLLTRALSSFSHS
ncbi:MAG TPA: response regulator transcription factor [Pyrinomonadaceae bacterium]|nr:response regulator transcription factor [Pyrinomonadaceae bacterium]